MREQNADGLSLNARAYLRYEQNNFVGYYPSKHKLEFRDVGSGKYQYPFANAGSPSRTRTSDPLINSQLLYQLSYWGTYQQKLKL